MCSERVICNQVMIIYKSIIYKSITPLMKTSEEKVSERTPWTFKLYETDPTSNFLLVVYDLRPSDLRATDLEPFIWVVPW